MKEGRYLLRVLVLTLAYYAAAKVGLSMAFVAAQVTAVWPPSGIAVAALLLFGRRMWPGVMLGAFLANVTASEPVWTAAAIAAGNTLEALIASGLLMRVSDFDRFLERRRDVLALTFFGAVLSTTAAATIGATSLCITGVQSWTQFRALWLVWWIGDGIGVILAAPLLMTWSWRSWTLVRSRWLEAAGLVSLLLVLTYAVFFSEGILFSRHLEYAIFPAVIWAAFRFGPPGATVASALIGSIAVAGTLYGGGPFADGSVNESLIRLQLFMGIVAVTGLLLAAAIRERVRVEERYRSLATATSNVVWATNAHGDVVEDLPTWRAFTGQTFQQMQGRGWTAMLHPDDRQTTAERWAESLRQTNTHENVFRVWHASGEYRYVSARGVPILEPNGAVREWIGALTDITDARRYEEALKEADRRKDEFLAMLAHELRNPLAPVQNALHILQTSPFDPARTAELIGVMSRQVEHLVQLVDDLLDTSRIVQGKIQLRQETTRLNTVIERAREILEPVLASSGHRLEIHPEAEPLWVYCDATRLAQVVGNLLHNAVKYSEPGDVIRLSTEREGSQALIRVKDWGAGIDPSHLPRIFDLFYQSDKSLDRSRGGLGIGLTLVRNIVEMHGGMVSAFSEGVGRGSEFVVSLAAAFPPAEMHESSLAPESTAAHGVVRVLVVDDNADAVETLCVFLEMAGYKAVAAISGNEAIDVAVKSKPHVILLDIGLPGMSGYEVAAWIRKHPELSATRLIALTGYGQDEDRQRCEEAGFDLHFVKPVDLRRLQSSIESLLSLTRRAGA